MSSDIESSLAGFEQLANIIGRVDANMEKLSGLAEQAFEVLRESSVDAGRAVDDVGKKIKTVEKHVEIGSKAVGRSLNEAEGHWRGVRLEMERHLTLVRGAEFNSADAAAGVSKTVGAMRSGMQQILGALPGGGLIGLMLYGMKRDAEFGARANLIARSALSAGGVVKSQISEINSMSRSMAAGWGSTGEEISAVLGNISSSDALGQLRDSAPVVTQFGASTLSYVVALEQAYNMQGQLSKLIHETYSAGGGTGLAEVAMTYHDIAETAKEAGTGVNQLASSLAQSGSTLRVQRQSLADLTAVYKDFYAQVRTGGQFGSNTAAAADAAARGVAGATGGLAGMSTEMKSVVGARMGGGGTGLDSWYAFEKGTAGGGGADNAFASKAIMALRDQIREATPGKSISEQVFALQQLTGMNFEGADAVMQYDGNTNAAAGILAKTKTPTEQLLQAFKTKTLSADPWAMAVQRILLAMSAVGSSLLAVTMSGFAVLATHFLPGSSAAQKADAINTFGRAQDKAGPVAAGAMLSVLNTIDAASDGAMPNFGPLKEVLREWAGKKGRAPEGPNLGGNVNETAANRAVLDAMNLSTLPQADRTSALSAGAQAYEAQQRAATGVRALRDKNPHKDSPRYRGLSAEADRLEQQAEQVAVEAARAALKARGYDADNEAVFESTTTTTRRVLMKNKSLAKKEGG